MLATSIAEIQDDLSWFETNQIIKRIHNRKELKEIMSSDMLQQRLMILVTALQHPEQRRQLITDFQRFRRNVNKDYIEEEWIEDILDELAYDLDFYEPNPEVRELTGNWGDDRFEEFVLAAFEKLRAGGVRIRDEH